MTLSYETAERLFHLGEFQEIARSVSSIGSQLDEIALPHRILLAHALVLVGDLANARRILGVVTPTTAAPTLRSKAEIVYGLISEGTGLMSEALEHYQAAVRFANASRDDVQVGWAQIRLLRHMIDRGSMLVVTGGVISQARRAASRAASPQVSAYLHLTVAALEGQNGRLDEAERHCDIADSLLKSDPNLWLRSGIAISRSSLAALRCRFEEASGYLLAARHDMLRSGTRSTFADCNLAHCQIVTGQFASARETLNRVIASPRASHLAILGGLEGLARMHLALGQLEQCRGALDRIEAAIQKDSSLAHVYHLRWATITRARFLLRSERPYEALSLMRDATQRYDGNDAPLTAAIHLTAAQACAALNDSSAATVHLAAAGSAGALTFRDLQALYYFTIGTVLRAEQPRFAQQSADRALRVWKAQRNVAVPLELDEATGTNSKPRRATVAQSDVSRGNTENASAAAIDHVAAVVDLCHTPELMAAEVVAAIQATRAAPMPKLRHITQTDGSALRRTHFVIPVSNDDHRRFAVVCERPDRPDKLAVLDAIRRIAEAALSLEQSREEDRRRAAVWPSERVEDQSGALFVGDEMQALLATARRVAPTTVPVLITGETGTGKEVLARTIHGYSTRARAAFLPFNCTSTPRDMLDSQLFGHRRGSFTGATENFQGVIRAAAGGTLFLDEIGDMGLDVQPKLLRFLESGEVHPVGETQPLRVDVRVVAATNANLDALVTDGRFREDLFYRLNIVRLHLPPLRERRMEIPALASHYLQKYSQEYDKDDLRLAEETMEYLLLYAWPGNVRQLANEMRRMAALCERGAVLMPAHLSADIAASRRTIPASERVLEPTEVVVRLDQPLPAALEHVERAMLQYALKKCGGRMEETAALLGLSRKGLYLKRHRFGIETPETRTAGAA